MDKQQTSREDVYEQYVDASVALFMKYYCDTLYDDVTDIGSLSENKGSDCFPEELDVRCRSLIKKTVKRQQIREKARYAGKVLRVLCSFAIVCLSLASLLFITVEAVRVPIINYYLQHSENNIMEIGPKELKEENNLSEAIDISDPLFGIIPDKYQLIMSDSLSRQEFSAKYEDNNGNGVFIFVQPSNGISGVDLQGVGEVQYFQIYNCDAVLAAENGITRLLWVNKETSTTYTLVISDDDLDAVSIADDFMRKIF
jgi:hypothetical protein